MQSRRAAPALRVPCLQASGVPLPAAMAEERRHDRVHRALTEVCTGLAMPMRDAARVMCSLAMNQISVLLKQFEVRYSPLQRNLRFLSSRRRLF